MPIILAPRPLADQDKVKPTKVSSEKQEDISLKLESTEITSKVPEQEADDDLEAELVAPEEEKTSPSEKMPKIMTNTVYDI